MKKSLKIFLLIILLPIFTIPSFAESVSTVEPSYRLDINLEIKRIIYTDALVVGDGFSYIINLTNPTLEDISDNFTIAVYDPKDRQINWDLKQKELVIKPNETQTIKLVTDYANEMGILRFDITGDYRIELNSTKDIHFYSTY